MSYNKIKDYFLTEEKKAKKSAKKAKTKRRGPFIKYHRDNLGEVYYGTVATGSNGRKRIVGGAEQVKKHLINAGFSAERAGKLVGEASNGKTEKDKQKEAAIDHRLATIDGYLNFCDDGINHPHSSETAVDRFKRAKERFSTLAGKMQNTWKRNESKMDKKAEKKQLKEDEVKGPEHLGLDYFAQLIDPMAIYRPSTNMITEDYIGSVVDELLTVFTEDETADIIIGEYEDENLRLRRWAQMGRLREQRLTNVMTHFSMLCERAPDAAPEKEVIPTSRDITKGVKGRGEKRGLVMGWIHARKAQKGTDAGNHFLQSKAHHTAGTDFAKQAKQSFKDADDKTTVSSIKNKQGAAKKQHAAGVEQAAKGRTALRQMNTAHGVLKSLASGALKSKKGGQAWGAALGQNKKASLGRRILDSRAGQKVTRHLTDFRSHNEFKGVPFKKPKAAAPAVSEEADAENFFFQEQIGGGRNWISRRDRKPSGPSRPTRIGHAYRSLKGAISKGFQHLWYQPQPEAKTGAASDDIEQSRAIVRRMAKPTEAPKAAPEAPKEYADQKNNLTPSQHRNKARHLNSQADDMETVISNLRQLHRKEPTSKRLKQLKDAEGSQQFNRDSAKEHLRMADQKEADANRAKASNFVRDKHESYDEAVFDDLLKDGFSETDAMSIAVNAERIKTLR